MSANVVSSKEILLDVINQINQWAQNYGEIPNTLIISKRQKELLFSELTNPYSGFKNLEKYISLISKLTIEYREVNQPIIFYENTNAKKYHGLTIKKLKKYIKNWDDNTPIYFQSIDKNENEVIRKDFVFFGHEVIKAIKAYDVILWESSLIILPEIFK